MTKLEGLIEAIEMESRLPSPSHGNFARLTAMAFRELLVSDQPPVVTSTASQGTAVVSEVKNSSRKSKAKNQGS